MARALVTGSTSGLGLEFAWQLAGTGHELVLVGRDVERLHEVARQIRHVHDTEIEVLAADVADRRQLDRVAVRLTDPVAPVDLLVTSGGAGLRGAFLESAVEDHEHQTDCLVRSVLVLSHAAATAMTQRRRGAILHVSSLAGYTTGGPYSAATSWITVFTQSLAAELEGTGVTATALLPGFLHADEREGAARTPEGLPRVTWLKAPFVVEQGLRDAARGVVLSIPSVRYRSPVEGRRGRARGSSGMAGALGPGLRRRLAERRLTRARRRASQRRLRAPWRADEDG